ncbi:MAG: methylenetetrahydrofolate reductase C-terminal domain-containing protein [Desulfocapsa sp.]|nr:methylenetetrahydrofolate reductase C-terminal domain-containing protein [Desulfocapsa sp.]
MSQSGSNIFRDSLLNPQEFTITYELVPGRGSGGKRLEKILQLAENAKADGRIKAFSVTDNPGGHPALSPTALGLDIQAMGISPLLHFSLKDKNRNMAESQLFECHRHDLLNLLILGGDFPRYGYQGQAMPVFDLDSPQLLSLIERLRHDFTVKKDAPGQAMDLPAMDFFAGCVVSPFKTLESEQVWQYVKLLTKIQCGAQFVISQLGFDMDKYAELIRLSHDQQLSVPLMANVFVPTLPVARIMNKGRIPGVILPNTLLQRMEEEAGNDDKGEEARLVRAAKMIAALREMGYAGIHLGGNIQNFESISFLLDKAEHFTGADLAKEVHFPEPSTWYLHKNCSDKPRKYSMPLLFDSNNFIHKQVFNEKGLLFPVAEKISLKALDNPFLNKIYTFLEHLSKKILFHCRMCGDCTLSESSYLCPQSGCPKRLVNGPCGGSIKGYCEVYPKEKLCFWVRSYHRGPKPDCNTIQATKPIPPKDWSLNRTSSWLNYFSGKDHCRLKAEKK